MKVLLPTNTTHTVELIPRFEPTSTLSLKITKEGYNSENTQVPTYVINYGVLSITFDLTGVNQDRYSFDLSEDENVVYKGKLFFTEQETQDFKLTKNTYIYV